jgi:hypothetical protein
MFEAPFTTVEISPSPSSHMKDIRRLMSQSIGDVRRAKRYRNSYEDMTHTYLRHKQKQMSLSERIERNKRRKHQLSQLTKSEIEIVRRYLDPSILPHLEKSMGTVPN